MIQRHCRTKLAVYQFNTILLQSLHGYLFGETPMQRTLNERFRIIGTLLEIRDEQLFEHTPEAIFELFLLMERHGELTDLSAKTLRAMWRVQHRVDAAFRRNPLNRYGILGRYLPAFGRIIGQMQHDLFHVYTADEYILMVVRNLRHFAAPEYA